MRMSLHWLAAVALAAGCGGGGASAPENAAAGVDGSAAVATPQTADLRLRLTDAPAAFDHVYVELTEIDAHRATGSGASDDGGIAAPDDGGIATSGEGDAGWLAIAVPRQTIDLLTLRDGVTMDLGGATVPAGAYDQLRFIVAGGQVVVAGAPAPLTVPSGMQTGIKLPLDLALAADMSTTLTLDFDAAASVVDAHGRYLLKPVIHVKSRSDAPRAPVDAGAP